MGKCFVLIMNIIHDENPSQCRYPQSVVKNEIQEKPESEEKSFTIQSGTGNQSNNNILKEPNRSINNPSNNSEVISKENRKRDLGEENDNVLDDQLSLNKSNDKDIEKSLQGKKKEKKSNSANNKQSADKILKCLETLANKAGKPTEGDSDSVTNSLTLDKSQNTVQQQQVAAAQSNAPFQLSQEQLQQIQQQYQIQSFATSGALQVKQEYNPNIEQQLTTADINKQLVDSNQQQLQSMQILTEPAPQSPHQQATNNQLSMAQQQTAATLNTMSPLQASQVSTDWSQGRIQVLPQSLPGSYLYPHVLMPGNILHSGIGQATPWVQQVPQFWTTSGGISQSALLAPNSIFIRGTQPDGSQGMFIQQNTQNTQQTIQAQPQQNQTVVSIANQVSAVAAKTQRPAHENLAPKPQARTASILPQTLPVFRAAAASSVSTQTAQNQTLLNSKGQKIRNKQQTVRPGVPTIKTDGLGQAKAMQVVTSGGNKMVLMSNGQPINLNGAAMPPQNPLMAMSSLSTGTFTLPVVVSSSSSESSKLTSSVTSSGLSTNVPTSTATTTVATSKDETPKKADITMNGTDFESNVKDRSTPISNGEKCESTTTDISANKENISDTKLNKNESSNKEDVKQNGVTLTNGLTNGINSDNKNDKELPKALIKPNVLTHVIEGYVIHEGTEPFPVTRQRYLEPDSDEPAQKRNCLENDISQDEIKSSDMVACVRCGKEEHKSKLKKKKYCSATCARASREELSLESNGTNDEDNHKKSMNGTAMDISENVLPNSTMDITENGVGEGQYSISYIANLPDPSAVIGKWTVNDVHDFLKAEPTLSDYAEDFVSQEIDGQALLLLNENHLVSVLGMKLGPAVKVIAKIEALKGTPATNGQEV